MTGASDTQASDTQASDTRASDTQASDTQASDTRASDTRASDTQASDTQASVGRASVARASAGRAPAPGDATAEGPASPGLAAAAGPAALGRLAQAAGVVLAISYPLLAISIGFRAVYQLCCRPDIASKVGPALSLVAAAVYLVAAVAFTRRSPRAWRVAVAALAFELAAVLAVGTVTLLRPELIQHSAWRRFGLDYGFFPLLQPLLGLLWLLWPSTRAAYGRGARQPGAEPRPG
jgi:hypothetical protein